ncbi:calmodulin 2-like protein [Chrysochromulina tobinii]|uniref:Calmodulin 2-like protein n=1 Tax=Chrysochromulina tobinii TaxID=1460289 RepID=A0A0M0JNM5_9EUKA|nr:calmodulin 2-like protein [Chrysochromulina tobinii]|eukprot:KOO28075.1 calmodulin 2-like protein [Chrysochromulina sp. CCMP291]
MLNDPEAKHSEAAVLGAGGYQAQQAAHDPHDDSVDSSAPRNGDGGRSRTPDHSPEPALRGNVEISWHVDESPRGSGSSAVSTDGGCLGAATSLLAQQLRERAQVGAAPEAAPLELTPAQKASVAGVIGQLKMALAKNLHRIIDTFREFDEDQSGKIDKREFRSALQKLGVVAHKSHYDLTFDSFDSDRSGRLTMAEFGHGLAMLGLVAKREEVQKLFHSFTADLNGTVSYRAIGSMLQKDAAILEKEALKRVLAGSLSRMNDRFREFDADGSGTVDKLEFRKVIASILPATDEACDAIFDEFDEDCSGEIQYVEYIRASLRGALKTSFTRVIDLFRKWDTDESGTIERAELHACLRAVGFDAPADVVDELFAEMDVDGSGSVEYKELHRVLRQGRSSKLHPNLRPVTIEELRAALTANRTRVIDAFRKLDKDSDGTITKAEFRGALPLLGFDTSRTDLADELFMSLDSDGGGTIRFDELNRKLRQGAAVELAAELKAGAAGAIELKAKNKVAPGSLRRGQTRGEPDEPDKIAPRSSRRPLLSAQRSSIVLKEVTVAGVREALAASYSRIIDFFKRMDKNGDGAVTKHEFRAGLGLLGIEESQANMDAIDALFDSFDMDGSGELTFNELKTILRYEAAKLEKREEIGDDRGDW